MLWQAVLARLEALENDNPGLETVEVNDDSDASLDDDDEQGLILNQIFVFRTLLFRYYFF